ncbi:hypothetical protein VFPPC_18050 [Pochonia chlamydosporia 170]|uniref:Uncharacterized protein n=1 Tax=Pochonia chlamydosporia 170 TaxID=1380566 RepID=A0A219ARI4_METCM|nr:hypothetical protein VFPPC_18050 [Pochonia chlamydosporia 170]OWT42795.1 hypothetical protein VFPPC_18050 [Pochonia chlamydosporia 170]
MSTVASHLSLATSEGDIDESSGVFETLESAALGDLGLLLGLNLYAAEISQSVIAVRGFRGRTGTGKRSVNFTHGDGLCLVMLWMRESVSGEKARRSFCGIWQMVVCERRRSREWGRRFALPEKHWYAGVTLRQ